MTNKTLIDEMIGSAAQDMASKLDNLIASAIEKEAGSALNFLETRKNAAITCLPGGVQILSYNGRDILKIWPIVMSQNYELESTTITFTQRYERIDPPEEQEATHG